MSFRFCAADFHCLNEGEEVGKAAAEEANRLLEEHVKTLQVLYGHDSEVGWIWDGNQVPKDTHRARLWDVQEVHIGEPCRHEYLNKLDVNNKWTSDDHDTGKRAFNTAKAECLTCGKRLVAEWREAE